MRKYAILILGLCWHLSAHAQSVDHFIDLAIKHNPGLEALRLGYESAKEQSNQVGDYPDPKVSLGIGVLPVETRLGAQRFKVGVSQSIPWKGLLDARKDTKFLQAQSLSYKDDVKEIDIAYAIRSAYNSLVFIEESKEVIKRKIELLDVLSEIAQSTVRSGKGKLSNVLLVQRNKEAMESDLILLEKKKEGPTIMINRWTGRPLDQSIEMSESIEVSEDVGQYIDFAQKDHPEFKILESQIVASEKSVELTFLEAKPKVGIGLDYAWIDGRNDVPNLSGNGRDILMPMGSISIPLHKDRFEAKRLEEKIKQESLNALKQEKQEFYLSEIAIAQSQRELAELEIKKVEQLKSITRETLELMRSEYSAEGTRFEELLRLEMELIDYDMLVAMSRYNQLNSAATLLKFQPLEK